VGVALIGPTLAIAASEWWGTLAAAGAMLVGGVALALLASLAVRQREAWLQARARRERFESARRAAVQIAGPRGKAR